MKSSLVNQGAFSSKKEEIVKSATNKKNYKAKTKKFEENLIKCLRGE